MRKNTGLIRKVLVSLLCAGLIAGCGTSRKSAAAEDDSVLDAMSAYQAEGIGGGTAYTVMPGEAFTVPSSILSSSSSFTISFWIKPSSNWPNTVLLSYEDESGSGIRLFNEGTNEDGSYHGLTLDSRKGDQEAWVTQDSSHTIKTGKWNHVMISVSGLQADLYLNGESAASGKLVSRLNRLSSAVLRIGSDAASSSPSLEGMIQNLKITDAAESSDQALAAYQELYPQVLLDDLSFSDTDDVQENFWLAPTLDEDAYQVAWTSDSAAIEVSKNHGVIHEPAANETVTLTASVQAYSHTYTKSYSFTVRAKSDDTDAYRDAEQMKLAYTDLINADTALPTAGSNGSAVTWSVDANADCHIEDNQIHKDSDAEKPKAEFHITVQKGSSTYQIDRELTVLDAYDGYLLSYFNGDEGQEAGHLAYSEDGLNWTDLPKADLFNSQGTGTGRVRDPAIERDRDGNFLLLATQGYDNPSIYLWHSTDLVSVTGPETPEIASYDAGTYESGKRAWAPECTYNPEDGLYYIYYSDPLNEEDNPGYIYYVTTSDFKTYSYPRIFFGPGYTVIDGTVLPLNGKYWLFYKDERKASSTVFYASKKSLSEGDWQAYDENFLLLHKYVEGPFVIPSRQQGVYYLYVDNYPYSRFYVASFSSLGVTNDIAWLSTDQYHLPNEDVRHGSAIQVTRKELDRILAAYQ